MKFLKQILVILSCAFFLISCADSPSDSRVSYEIPGPKPVGPDPVDTDPEKPDAEGDINPRPFVSKNKNLDLIFSLDEPAEIAVNISRDEWNKMLKYYDWWSHHETCVKTQIVIKKKNHTWTIDNAGIRDRGKASRNKRPQVGFGKDGKYVQPHWKLDFEEFLESDEEYKMADCMKGVILKRFKDDSTYAREIYGYNFFRNNGIWNAPRAGYAHLVVNITDKDEEIQSVDYGVYAMIEQIDKQFLKSRTQKQLGTGIGFLSKDGNLWKCSEGATLVPGNTSIGVEKKSFNDFEWTEDIISTNDPGRKEQAEYNYDLKNNKTDLETAKLELNDFVDSLNSVSDDPAEIKAWYEAHVDVALLLKTYACSVALSMWDDYWGHNGANWYCYFDKEKFYFIPYDYDNILGINDNKGVDFATQDPFLWNYKGFDAPLMDKVMQVPEYKKMYAKYLMEVTKSDSMFDSKNAADLIFGWQSKIRDFVSGATISYSTGGDTVREIKDGSSPNWCVPNIGYELFTDVSGSPETTRNFFIIRRNTIEKCCKEYIK